MEILGVDAESAAMLTLTVIMSDVVRERDGISLPKLSEKLGNLVIQESTSSFETKDDKNFFLDVGKFLGILVLFF
jgi:hypothetical protein